MTFDVICLICKTMHKANYPAMLLPPHVSAPGVDCAGASGLPVALIHVYVG